MTEQSEMKTDRENYKKILPFFKGFISFILVTLSLFHVFFESKSKLISQNDKEYNSLIIENKSLTKKYREDLKNRRINIDDYLFKTNELLLDSQSKINKLNIEKRAIKNNFSFNGRSSFHFWLFVFGLVSALFYFACKSLFDEISRGSTFRHQLVSISGIIVAFFWFVHLIFYTQNDFNKNTYFFTILVLATLFSIFTYFLVKYYTYKDIIIRDLIKLIVKIKSKHYPKILVKALYAERENNDLPSTVTVKNLANDFDKDIRNTFNSIDN